MEIIPEIDESIKKESDKWADNVYEKIKDAFKDPAVGLPNDVIKVYKEYKQWGIFDSLSILNIEYKSLYLKLFSMYKYKILLNEKNNPPKKTKWEYVFGKVK